MAQKVGSSKIVGERGEEEAPVLLLSAEEEKAARPNLPPAGWQRREELAKRQAELERTGEELAGKIGIYSIDPQKFRPDPEMMRCIKGNFDFAVSNPRRGYHYCWGTMGEDIQRKRRLGFEFVKGDDQEAKEHAESFDAVSGTAAGLRKIGDVYLLRLQMAIYEQLLYADAYERASARSNVNDKTLEAAQRLGLDVTPLSALELDELFVKDAARKAAMEIMGNKLKDTSGV